MSRVTSVAPSASARTCSRGGGAWSGGWGRSCPTHGHGGGRVSRARGHRRMPCACAVGRSPQRTVGVATQPSGGLLERVGHGDGGRGSRSRGVRSRQGAGAAGRGTDVRNLARLRTQLGIMQLQLDPPELESAVANLSVAAEQMASSVRGRSTAAQRPRAGRGGGHGGDVAQAERLAATVFEQAGSEAPLLAADARPSGPSGGRRRATCDGCGHVQAAVFLLTGVGADRAAGQRWLELGTLLESVGEEQAARQAYRSAAASAGLRVRPRSTVWTH